jgi:5-methylcytosine-specific restriction endonuclease McrA
MSGPLHIVQGGVKNGEKNLLERIGVRGGSPSSLIAPKTAAVGDDVIIYVGGYGLFATARIAGPTKKRPDWHNRYGAPLSNVRLIQPTVSLGVLERQVPRLKWVTYPRSITTVEPMVAAQLHTLVERRKRLRRAEAPERSRLEDLSLEELYSLAVARSAARAGKATRSVAVPQRKAAVRAYVLARAGGICELCRMPAPFLDVKGNPYLEAHHITRLADEGPDHPKNGIAICPNCHRRAHYSANVVDVMRRMKKRVVAIQRRLAF